MLDPGADDSSILRKRTGVGIRANRGKPTARLVLAPRPPDRDRWSHAEGRVLAGQTHRRARSAPAAHGETGQSRPAPWRNPNDAPASGRPILPHRPIGLQLDAEG